MVANDMEFYTTPEGEVMMKKNGLPAKALIINDRDIISNLLITIKERYNIAFIRLTEKYAKNELNSLLYEFNMVSRFLRCNCGEYDQYKTDLDNEGHFHFEEVRCPLRGECRDEGIICKPKLNTTLSKREMEVLDLISDGLQANEIADQLFISAATVNRHRENIKVKLHCKNIGELVNYYVTNFK